uniref:40S ribosomal protein S8 n=1 Tax=Aegilops tauschii subsp. strangulata TaxID=200361 RepID=A0A453BTI7_AEGTS
AGISRDSMHKRRATGGKQKAWRKKRKYELGRQPANTKLSSNKTVRRVRVRGGNVKWRALRLDTGNFSWGSEAVTRKTRLLDVVYNSSNNELVRTQTLVKNAIVQVDAAPFKQWYLTHYGVEIGRKKKAAAAAKKEAAEVLFLDKRLRLLLLPQRKQRRATMSRGSLRSASRDVHWTRTLRSSSVVEGCWPAFRLALDSVAELMGTSWRARSWSST